MLLVSVVMTKPIEGVSQYALVRMPLHLFAPNTLKLDVAARMTLAMHGYREHTATHKINVELGGMRPGKPRLPYA